MKRKNKQKNKLRTQLAKKLIIKIALLSVFALVGVLVYVRSYAATPDTSARCVTSQQAADGSKQSVGNRPVCLPIGSTGGVVYWPDNSIPGKRIHVTRIDLNNRRLAVRASSFSERGKTPTQFAKHSASIVAVNGDFFYKDNNFITNGLAVGGAEQWPFTRDRWHTTFIACTMDRDCFIDEINRETQVNPIRHVSVVSGSETLLAPNYEWTLRPGQQGCGTTCSSPHPRTGVALSGNRKVMWFVMVEGGHSNIAGLSLYDFTQVFKRLGARWAINLDGGGSSGMAINGRLINQRPSNEPQERRVGNALGIVELPASK